ncbi:L-threonylcarbamoyladenylate synthase [Saccharicrinis aurantiacus]|uniref:L-threonylcarbamoyladenylate synthase n=1 Tax=Saccharicrinis aurantiacus TaxID=1849719 RepID=UPI00094FDD5E|nr:L-threonylcarbamoyladenylate synthase [Saccharicrinis aurantiacus]
MLLKIYPENPNPKDIRFIAEELRKGKVIIYPTDTIYGIGCDINNTKAVERVARIKNINLKKDHLSFICYDLSHISDYTKNINNNVFKIMKRNLPGPFTFILDANSNVPKLFKNNKKTVGIRIPDNNIIRELINELGHPILSTSVIDDDEIIEYTTDPELIYEKYHKLVDIVIDGGFGDNSPSTIVNCTNGDVELIREGKGTLEY